MANFLEHDKVSFIPYGHDDQSFHSGCELRLTICSKTSRRHNHFFTEAISILFSGSSPCIIIWRWPSCSSGGAPHEKSSDPSIIIVDHIKFHCYRNQDCEWNEMPKFRRIFEDENDTATTAILRTFDGYGNGRQPQRLSCAEALDKASNLYTKDLFWFAACGRTLRWGNMSTPRQRHSPKENSDNCEEYLAGCGHFLPPILDEAFPICCVSCTEGFWSWGVLRMQIKQFSW